MEFDPSTASFSSLYFYETTDLYCPGCGATRTDRGREGLTKPSVTTRFSSFTFLLPLFGRSVWLGVVKNKQISVPQQLSKYLLALAIVDCLRRGEKPAFGELAWMRP